MIARTCECNLSVELSMVGKGGETMILDIDKSAVKCEGYHEVIEKLHFIVAD